MTPQTKQVLVAMASAPAARNYGYELSKATGLPSGTLYPILRRLTKAGWLEAGWADEPDRAGPRRRYYTLTPSAPQV